MPLLTCFIMPDVLIRKVTRKLVVPLVAPPRPLTPPPPVPTGAPQPAASATAPAPAPVAGGAPAAGAQTQSQPLSSSQSNAAAATAAAAPTASPALPKIPSVTCAAYAPEGDRVVAGTSEGDLFWWRGALFVNKMRGACGRVCACMCLTLFIA